jgi:glycosyltransferase involved in cell wall biosynthesis
MRALFFGTYDAAAHPRVGILMRGLRDHGIDVVECNVPLGLSTAHRVSMLTRPWQLPKLALRLARCWTALVRGAHRLPRADVVVVGYLGHFDVRLARRLYRRTPIVLDHLIGASDTGADRGVHAGLRQRLLRRIDRRALAAADLVVVDTKEHLEVLPADDRRKAVVVAVGAPQAWLDAGASAAGRLRADEPLRVVFFGLYTPLQGAPTIGRALALLVDEPLETMMLGSGQDYDQTRELARGNLRVTWRDWVPPRQLPDLVAAHDVCLGIFGTSPKARRVVPNKVFQGAAAGCALVTSDTAPQRRLLQEDALFVPPGDAEALAGVLRELVRDRPLVTELREAARRRAHEAFTPARVTAALVDRLTPLADATRTGSPR